MFSLQLDWKHFYDFDVFSPGDVLYVTKTNIKTIEDARPFIRQIINHIVGVCQNNNFQFLILHNQIHPFSMEESLEIERCVSKKMAYTQTLKKLDTCV
jgi:hypothetical protein